MKALSKSPVVIFLFSHDWQNVNVYNDRFPGRTSLAFNSSEDLLQFSSAVKSVLVLASIQNKDNLLELAKLVEGIQSSEFTTRIMIVALNFTESDEYTGIFSKLGIRNVLDPSLSFDDFEFQMDFWLTSLDEEKIDVEVLTRVPHVNACLNREEEMFNCVLDDYFENTFIFKLTKEGLESGDLVELDITYGYMEEDSSLKAKGMVSIIDSDNQFVSVDLLETNLLQIEKLMRVYEDRQKNAVTFLHYAKGI